MALNVASLLTYSDAVPAAAREALRAANAGPPESRAIELESAARVLFAQTDLDCCEVRELVGLPPGDGCS